MTSYLRFFDYDKALNYYCELIEKMNQCTNRNNHERIIAKPILVPVSYTHLTLPTIA